MAEPNTEPGWKPARPARPWWATALISGLGVGAAIAAALGLSGMQARGNEPPPVRTAGMAATPLSEAEWRAHIDAKLSDMGERLARIEGRLERK